MLCHCGPFRALLRGPFRGPFWEDELLKSSSAVHRSGSNHHSILRLLLES